MTKIEWQEFLATQKQLCKQGLIHLKHRPFISIITTIIISLLLTLAASLPAAFYLLQHNADNWAKNSKITLYLTEGTMEADARQLLTLLRQRSDVAKAAYISPTQGLKELARHLSSTDILDGLPSNPLPAVIEVMPVATLSVPTAYMQLVDYLKTLPHTEKVQFDMDGFKHEYSLLRVGGWPLYGACAVLCLIVLFIIINAVEMFFLQENRQAPEDFAYYSFVYAGVLMGISGVFIAYLITYNLLTIII